MASREILKLLISQNKLVTTLQWKKAQKLKLELQKKTRQDKTGVLKSVYNDFLCQSLSLKKWLAHVCKSHLPHTNTKKIDGERGVGRENCCLNFTNIRNFPQQENNCQLC